MIASLDDSPQPVDQPVARAEHVRLPLDEQIAGKEMAGDAEAGKDVVPIGGTSVEQKGGERKETVAVIAGALGRDGAAALGADEGEAGRRSGGGAFGEIEAEAELAEEK